MQQILEKQANLCITRFTTLSYISKDVTPYMCTPSPCMYQSFFSCMEMLQVYSARIEKLNEITIRYI